MLKILSNIFNRYFYEGVKKRLAKISSFAKKDTDISFPD